jgi:hypothetical protein
MNNSAAIFFGKNGRIGQICAEAVGKTIDSYSIRRGVIEFQSSQESKTELSHEQLIASVTNKKIYLFDCSIDHSSTEAILAHEIEKQNKILEISSHAAKLFYIGFSSGIMSIPEERIKLSHMKTYRSAKEKQEKFAEYLNTPCFVPRIYTLIGRNTYIRKAAAWASILAARIQNEPSYLITDPNQKREWVSEVNLKERVKRFIDNPSVKEIGVSISEGTFTHGEIAQCETDNNLTPLNYITGESKSWLIGDYVSAYPPKQDHVLLMKSIKQFIPEV